MSRPEVGGRNKKEKNVKETERRRKEEIGIIGKMQRGKKGGQKKEKHGCEIGRSEGKRKRIRRKRRKRLREGHTEEEEVEKEIGREKQNRQENERKY